MKKKSCGLYVNKNFLFNFLLRLKSEIKNWRKKICPPNLTLLTFQYNVNTLCILPLLYFYMFYHKNKKCIKFEIRIKDKLEDDFNFSYILLGKLYCNLMKTFIIINKIYFPNNSIHIMATLATTWNINELILIPGPPSDRTLKWITINIYHYINNLDHWFNKLVHWFKNSLINSLLTASKGHTLMVLNDDLY